MNASLKIVDQNIDEADTLKRIERYIASPPENSRIFSITPEVAEVLLDARNDNNRPRSTTEIKKLADHMVANDWSLTGDTIKFSVSGRILDGQHRLTACVQSGKPFRTHVVFGIDDNAFNFLDVGRKRTPAHILSIAGYPNASRLAGAVRWAYLVDEKRVKLRDTLEPNKVLHLARERYPTLGSFLPIGQSINRVSPLVTDTIGAAMVYHFHRANSEKATSFYEGWANGAWGGKFRLFEKLNIRLRELSDASEGRVNDVVRAALIVRAWNAFIAGRVGKTSDFTWSLKDEFPEIRG